MTKPSRKAPATPVAHQKPPEARAGMQLVSRIALILRAMEGQQVGLSLGQIAKASGLPRPTVQRIVDALCAEGFLMTDGLHGGVCLGPLVAQLATSVQADLAAVARPHLEQLCWKLGETVAMTVLQDGKVVVIALVTPPTQQLRLTANVGSTWPLHCSAEGKALLAGLPDETIRSLLGTDLVKRTPKTVTSVAAILRELRDVAASQIALDREGTGYGISSIAIGLKDAADVRYAISILTTTARFDPSIERFGNELRACRSSILKAARLGL